MQLLAYVLLTETFFLTKKLKAPIARKRPFDRRRQTSIAHRVTFPARNFLSAKRCKGMRRITSGFTWVLTHKMSLVIV